MAISPNQHACSILMWPEYTDVATLDLSRSTMIIWGLRRTPGGNTFCACLCVFAWDLFISFFLELNLLTERRRLEGQLLHIHNVISNAFWLWLYCDFITAALTYLSSRRPMHALFCFIKWQRCTCALVRFRKQNHLVWVRSCFGTAGDLSRSP